MSKQEIGGARLPTAFDKVMASTVGVTTNDWVNTTKDIDTEDYEYITSKLMSDEDRDIKLGIQMFNDLKY